MLEKNDLNVKALSAEERERLCEEIRRKIIETVTVCGGHLSSNLGVVELTVGMFFVFDFPRDKVIWDVGHQCYAYKLLSGRYEKFHTLRPMTVTTRDTRAIPFPPPSVWQRRAI